MPYRVALIGCGMIGSGFADDPLMADDIFTHAEAYTRCPDTTLVALCDTDAERLRRCGKRWGVGALYGDVSELLERERPDLVSICTPDPTHYDVLRTVITSDHRVKGVLCEKPLATSLDQARELVQTASAAKLTLAINYLRRYAKNICALKSFLEAGKLGRIQAIGGWYTKGVLHNGSHWFDLLRYLVGNVQWVQAWRVGQEGGPDPTLDVMLGLKDGGLASLRACDARKFAVFEMDIMGTDGRIHLVDSGYVIAYDRVIDSPRYSGFRELSPGDEHFGDRRHVGLHAVEDLVAAVKSGRPPACTAEDGLAALQIAFAARRSVETGQRVPVPN